MGCSEAQLAANRANAARSSGPRTEAGKERSRRNSLRHGLTGAGIVLPTEDVAEIEARFADFEADLKPEGGVARFLVRRAAMLSVRLDRSALHEAASLTTSILALDTDEPVDIEAGMEELFESLVVRPGSARMELISQSEGVDRLVAALVGIRRTLDGGEGTAWSRGHSHLLEALLGHDTSAPPARSKLLSDVVLGDDSPLKSVETAHLDPSAKRPWAADRLARLIDAEVDQLRDHQATLPPPGPCIGPTAANLALFDPSTEASLARRYEATTERALFRTLKEIRQANAQQAGEKQVKDAEAAGFPPELGSFCSTPRPVGPRPNSSPPMPGFAEFGLDLGGFKEARRPERAVIGRPPAS